MPGPVWLVNHEYVDVVAPKQPQALLNRPHQPIPILSIEGLRPAAKLGRQYERHVNLGQNVAQDLLTVEIAGRRVDVVDSQLDGTSNGEAGLLEGPADLGHEQTAHSEPADRDACAP
jgi:hypothetical protein